MKPIFIYLLLSIIMNLSIWLNAQELTENESKLLTEHFEINNVDVDFSGKKVGFFRTTKPWSKAEFFEDLNERNDSNQPMLNQLIILTERQRKASGGYNVFIYSRSKFRISKKQVGRHINKIKKYEAKQTGKNIKSSYDPLQFQI